MKPPLPIAANSLGTPVVSHSAARACPVCGTDRPEPLFDNRLASIAGIDFSYRVVACHSCRMVYASQAPDDATLRRYYREFSKYDQPRSVDEINPSDLHRAEVAAAFTRRILPAGSHVLDVGCSIGLYLSSLVRAGPFKVRGLDPSATSATMARDFFDIDVEVGDAYAFERFDAFDAVALLAVIEHLRDPEALFRTLFRSMKPGATLIIEVPNADLFGSYPAIGRVSEPFGEFSNEHINFFGDATLRRLAERVGFSWIASEELPYLADVSGLLAAFRKGGGSVGPPSVRASDLSVRHYVTRSAAAMKSVESRLAEALQGERRVVVYGAGSHTARMLAQGGFRGLRIEAVVDRNPHLTGQTIAELPIVLPDVLASLPHCPVIVSSFHAMSAIARELAANFNHRIVTLYPAHGLVPTHPMANRATKLVSSGGRLNVIPSA